MFPLVVNYSVQNGRDEQEEKVEHSMNMMVRVRIKRFYEGNHLLQWYLLIRGVIKVSGNTHHDCHIYAAIPK